LRIGVLFKPLKFICFYERIGMQPIAIEDTATAKIVYEKAELKDGYLSIDLV